MAGSGFHHVAVTCKNLKENHRFYGELIGLELVHTEVHGMGKGFMRHAFYDVGAGDGSCLAFFDLHGVGEADDARTDISTGLGLPQWANHIAIRSTAEEIAEVVERCRAAGYDEIVEHDHGWCRSTYIVDPNGISLELSYDTPGFQPDPVEAERLLDALPEGFEGEEQTGTANAPAG